MKQNKVLNSEELINILHKQISDKRFKKQKRLPRFSIQEAEFIKDLIFHRKRGLLFFYLADHLMNDTIIRHLPMFNAPSMKKLQFLYNLLGGAKSAKEAAIKAGYSPRTAKQQASRTLRQIQGFKRWS